MPSAPTDSVRASTGSDRVARPTPPPNQSRAFRMGDRPRFCIIPLPCLAIVKSCIHLSLGKLYRKGPDPGMKTLGSL